MSDEEIEALVLQPESDLKSTYGSPILTLEQLSKVLNYKSLSALRQAIARKQLAVPLFQLPNRRGKFALIAEVAKFLAQQAIDGKTNESQSDE